MKTYGGMDVLLHIFLMSALDRGLWSASHPLLLYPWGKGPGTHWIGHNTTSTGAEYIVADSVDLWDHGIRVFHVTHINFMHYWTGTIITYSYKLISTVLNNLIPFIKVKVKLSLYLTKHHAMKTYWGSGGIAQHLLDFSIRWRWVVSFTPWPLYPQGKSPWYPLDRRLGGPQSCSRCGDEEINSQLPLGIEP
jgi:hypothetical protein